MLNVFRRLFAAAAIRIEDGKAQCIKGTVPGNAIADVTDVCRQKSIMSGEIWISSGGRISFSSKVPDAAHQRIRNVVASR